MTVTRNLAKYVEDIGINLSELSKKSGIEYSMLYASLGNGKRTRELKADELTSICSVLRINPMDFADSTVSSVRNKGEKSLKSDGKSVI